MITQDHIDHINEIINNFGTSLTNEQREAALAAITRARENIEWLTYHEQSISEWLTAEVVVAEAGSIMINMSLLLFAIFTLRFLLI